MYGQYQAGDILLTDRDSFLGKMIKNVQQVMEPGDEAMFSHVAVITDSVGTLIESSRTISAATVEKYKGVQCLLARHVDMTPEKFALGYKAIEGNLGQVYPFHRLFMIPLGLSKINRDWPVCSELAAQFYLAAGLDMDLQFRGKPWQGRWTGVTPDVFEDAIGRRNKWRIVAQGPFIE